MFLVFLGLVCPVRSMIMKFFILITFLYSNDRVCLSGGVFIAVHNSITRIVHWFVLLLIVKLYLSGC